MDTGMGTKQFFKRDHFWLYYMVVHPLSTVALDYPKRGTFFQNEFINLPNYPSTVEHIV